MLIKLIYLVLLYKVNMILKYKLNPSIYKTYILSFHSYNQCQSQSHVKKGFAI